jgi:hypothetical protein
MGFGETDPDCWLAWLQNALWESAHSLPFSVRWDMGMFDGTDAWLEFGMAAFLMAQGDCEGAGRALATAQHPCTTDAAFSPTRVPRRQTVTLAPQRIGTTRTGRTMRNMIGGLVRRPGRRRGSPSTVGPGRLSGAR